MPSIRTASRLLPAVALLLSCSGGDLVLPSEGEPATITIVEGQAQSGRVGAPLGVPVVARVTDSQGRPVIGVPVAFAFTGGVDATVAPDTADTDADGRAAFQVVLGTQVGAGNAELRVSTADGSRTLGAPLQFTAVSADANELVAISGDSQSAPAGGTLADPLVVQVTDGFGNPIAGVDVTWAAVDGGSVSETIVPTGADGFAAVQATLGPNAGIQHTTASAPGLAGSPVTFTHTALPGAATTLERISGDNQSAVVGTSLPDPLVVRARDAAGNPVAGLGVTWVVTTGGGTVLPQNGTTGPDGLASTRWSLGPSPGGNTVAAVISGVGTVGFTATGEAGAPPGLSIETQPPATAVRGIALSRNPVVQLREPDGSARAQAGIPVTVDLAAVEGTLRGTLTRNTGPDGRAEFRDLILEGPAGSYALGFAAPGYAGTTSSAVALSRAPTTLAITADSPDPSVAGAAVRVTFRLASPGGSPAGTVRVSADDGTSCSATAADGACTLSLSGVGSRTITAAFSGNTEFEGSSDTESHQVQAPPPPALALVTQPPPTATVGTAFDAAPVVQLRDAGGADLHTPGVTVSVALASGKGVLAGPGASTTGPDGRASFPGLVINGGTGRHTLRFTAEGYTPVTSDPIDVRDAPPAPTTTTITADAPDPSDVGQPVLVSFSVTASAGTPTGSVKVTASGGGETCTGSVAEGGCTLTLTSAGSRTLTASYAGENGFAGSTDDEEHTVRAPAPAVPSATTSTVAAAQASIPLGGSTQVIVTVRDAGSAPLQGVSVTLSASGSGNDITPASAATDGRGVATFTFRGTTAGARVLTAVAGGITIAQQASVTVGQAETSTQITSDEPDPSAPGAAVSVAVTVRSPAGIPTGSFTVTASDGAETCSATLAATGSVAEGSCTLTLTGSGDRTLTAAYPGDANFASSSDAKSHTVAAPALVIHKQPSSTAVSGAPLRQQPEVELQDAGGEKITTGGIVVTASLGSGSGSLSGTRTSTTGPNGRAVFDDLVITGPADSYTLEFTASGFASVTSSSIELEPAQPVGAGDAFSTPEDQPLAVPAGGVLSNDSDPAGGSLVAQLVSGPAHGRLSLASDGSFGYTPDPDFNGTDGFTYRASDGARASDAVAVQLTVEPVNDPPSFVTGEDPTVSALGGPVSLSGWATNISPGPADESAQAVTFLVDVGVGAIYFTSPPTIAPDGTLSFTPSGIPGTPTVSVRARDDGGIAGGGADTSDARTFTITLTLGPGTPGV